jgi:hypothetical protein
MVGGMRTQRTIYVVEEAYLHRITQYAGLGFAPRYKRYLWAKA